MVSKRYILVTARYDSKQSITKGNQMEEDVIGCNIDKKTTNQQKRSTDKIKNDPRFKELMRCTDKHAIKILESVYVKIVTKCETSILSPSQWVSSKLAKALVEEEILKDEKTSK